jgi:hypothetical protein
MAHFKPANIRVLIAALSALVLLTGCNGYGRGGESAGAKTAESQSLYNLLNADSDIRWKMALPRQKSDKS